MAINEPETQPDVTNAKITIGAEEQRRIVNFDETDHPFSTVNDKGVSRSVRWGSPNLTGDTTKGTRGSRHTTGTYGFNAAGEAMPPIYYFDSNTASDDNYQVKPLWVSRLPVVQGKYGCLTTK